MQIHKNARLKMSYLAPECINAHVLVFYLPFYRPWSMFNWKQHEGPLKLIEFTVDLVD